MAQLFDKTISVTTPSGDESAPQSLEEQFGQYLIDRGKLRAAEFRHARRLALEESMRLSVMLIRLGLVSERDIAEAFSALLDLPLWVANEYDGEGLNGEVSLQFLKEARAMPVSEEEDAVVLAMADPSDSYVRDAVALAYGKSIRLQVGLPSEIEATLDRQAGSKSAMGQIVEHLDSDEDAETDVQHLKDMASEAPVVRLVNLLIQRALESRASDIHIEPFESRLRVRYRIDGVLQDVEAPPARSTAAVISRFKIMAKLNIAERRLPQDGRIQLRIQGRELDLRVSTVPTLYGESVVLRLLDKGSVVLDFDSLGFQGSTLERFLRVLELPHGIIIVTGPTGSGKSTTLYTALHKLNTPDRKIVTVEDPVEYQLEGVNQIQVKPQIGLTFASALRSIVRQDPDVIMIGEMRDRETAGIAVQSALTGHLVLSTLHTNDAPGGVTRLLDMGVEDYLLTSTVNGILAQRLVRTLCKHCAKPYEAMPELVEEMELHRFSQNKPVLLYRPVGCENCNNIGYHGRAAIMEFLVVSDSIRRLVLQHADSGSIQEQAQKEGMVIMYEDGLSKALSGLTTIEEVIRVSQES